MNDKSSTNYNDNFVIMTTLSFCKIMCTMKTMETPNHRHRVAAERRDRMRGRLLASAMQLAATKGPASTSIDDIISTAGVSRGTFYKYFPSPDTLLRELAVEIANDLIRMAEPVVLERSDPAERIACGIRLVSRLAIDHPLAASFLVRMGWPDTRGPNLLLDFVQRDLEDGIRQKRFRPMPMALALNIVAGAVLGATHTMLHPGHASDFAELSAAAALRALGVDADTADQIAMRPIQPLKMVEPSLLAQTMATLIDHPTQASEVRLNAG